MSNLALASEHFQRFPVDRLIDNSVTDFDLFLQVDKHLILYSGNGYRWEKQELDGLLRGGYRYFFIKPEEMYKAQIYEKVARIPQVQKELAPHERMKSIEDVGAAFVKYLYEGELTESCVRRAESLAESIVNCVVEDRSCIQAITGLADHDQYTYLHSVRVAAYATAVALQMGLTDESQLKFIAVGGIFHDVGKSMVPLSIINKSGPLLDHEWQQMKAHPTNGFNKINQSILGQVPREIVLHHHERLNGSGYPDGLDRGSLLMEVQIASLADIFDALTSARAYQTKRTRFEALDFIRHKLLRSDVSVDAFKALVECLIK